MLWKRLEHKSIVRLFGMTSTPLQLVSEWIPGGDLTEYVGKHPETDRPGLVRVFPPYPMMYLPSRKLRDTADGLHYLHSRNVVHGDLKGVRDNSKPYYTVLTPSQPNVLVDADGHARITDFGLAMITQDSVRSAFGDQGHTARWTAPEILNEEGTYSKEADVFSFAMVMIEVCYRSPSLPRFGLPQHRRSPARFRSGIAYLQWLCWR